MPPRRAGGSSKGDWSPFEAAPPEAGKSVSAETLAAWWVWASARKWGAGPCPAQCIWQGSGFAADQTNAMLAVGGTSCISLVSVAAADENSLTPLHRRLPTETASLGFGGSPVGGGDKNSHFTFFRHFYVGGITTLRPLWLCRKNPARGLLRQKNGFLRVGALRRRTRCSLLHTVLFWHLYAWGGIITLGVRFMPLKRWTPAGHGGVFAVFMPLRNSPCAG